MLRYLLFVLLVVTCLYSSFSTAQAASYTFTTLDMPDGTATLAYGINNRGQIVGYYTEAGQYHGFLYAVGIFTPLDVPDAGTASN